jgi:hypothetical protein
MLERVKYEKGSEKTAMETTENNVRHLKFTNMITDPLEDLLSGFEEDQFSDEEFEEAKEFSGDYFYHQKFPESTGDVYQNKEPLSEIEELTKRSQYLIKKIEYYTTSVL